MVVNSRTTQNLWMVKPRILPPSCHFRVPRTDLVITIRSIFNRNLTYLLQWWGIMNGSCHVLPCFAKSVRMIPSGCITLNSTEEKCQCHLPLARFLTATQDNIVTWHLASHEYQSTLTTRKWTKITVTYMCHPASNIWGIFLVIPKSVFLFNGYLRPIGDDSQTNKPFKHRSKKREISDTAVK